jgi:hypothetical protein
VPHGFDVGGAAVAERRREPPLDDAAGNGGHTASADGFHARVPNLGRAQVRRGIGKNQPVHARRLMSAKPHPHHATERKAAEMNARHLQPIQQTHNVAGEQPDAVGAWSYERTAMPAAVVAEDLEGTGEHLDLLVPHGQIRAE